MQCSASYVLAPILQCANSSEKTEITSVIRNKISLYVLTKNIYEHLHLQIQRMCCAHSEQLRECLFIRETLSGWKKHNTVWSWCLLNLKPLNVKSKLNIMRRVYVYTFLAYWRYIIIIGVKYYFLWLRYIVVMTPASYVHM